MAVLLIGALCACGETETAVKEAPSGMESNLPGTEFEPAQDKEAQETTAEVVDTDETALIEELKEKAKSLTGKDVNTMLSKLGEPNSVEEVPTCLGDGTEKMYTYDRLKINTYSEGTEVVINVIILDKDGNTALDEDGTELIFSYK